MNYRLIFLLFVTVFVISKIPFAQNIVFKNPENRIMHDFLDTAFSVNDQNLTINIGPDSKQKQNTIFFNGAFDFKRDQIDLFRIKGSYLKHLVIDSSKFGQERILIDSTDFDTLFITKSSFKKAVIFKDIYIRDFDFSYNELPEEILFINCVIPNFKMLYSSIKYLSFTNCTIGNLNLEGSMFAQSLSLSGNTLTGNVSFDNCAFKRNLILVSLKTDSLTKFSFLSTILPDTLDFSNNIRIRNTVDLTKANKDIFIRKCKIYLNKFDVSKLVIDYSFFKLIFPKNFSTDEKENLYDGLLQNLKSNAYQQSYQALDIEYRRFHAKQGTFGFLWWIPDLWWEYGYDRGRIFKIVFWSILILSLLNSVLLNYLVTKVYEVGNIPAYYLKWNLSRFWYAFVYTCIIFFSLSIKVDKIKYKEKLGTLYLMAIYVFGIICLAYMANYIIQR